MNNQHTHQDTALTGNYAKALLQELSLWGDVTTIIIHGGCVFEFKGVFPAGSEGAGYYNLKGGGSAAASAGFEGHISLEKIAYIAFQDTPHRGKESYAFVFTDHDEACIFKVFLGRDSQGELIEEQVARFKAIQGDAGLLIEKK